MNATIDRRPPAARPPRSENAAYDRLLAENERLKQRERELLTAGRTLRAALLAAHAAHLGPDASAIIADIVTPAIRAGVLFNPDVNLSPALRAQALGFQGAVIGARSEGESVAWCPACGSDDLAHGQLVDGNGRPVPARICRACGEHLPAAKETSDAHVA